MNRSAGARVDARMQRIGQATVRAFKTLAGLERDEPAEAWVYALYSFLLLVAFALVALWLLGPSA